MKKITNVILIVLLSISSVISVFACSVKFPIEVNDDIKNIIILIGDGMGQNHIHNAKTYFELDDQRFEESYITTLDTDSLTKGSPTDSAAGGTALATGVNVENGMVGQNNNQILKNIMEYASDKNMLTGIVTDDYLYGATPASFSAHTPSRGNVGDIMYDQATGPIDLLIGQYSEEYYNYESIFTSNGYEMYNNTEDLYLATYPQKVVANINNVHSIYNPNYSNQINMLDLVKYAMEYLDNENGFVLMVECAYIDKFSHGNDIISSLSEVRTLFDIANYIYDYIDDNSDTALIVTADHETGGLQKTNIKAEITDDLYTTDDHTNSFVNLYSRGLLKNDINRTMKNTIVFDSCYKVIFSEEE